MLSSHSAGTAAATMTSAADDIDRILLSASQSTRQPRPLPPVPSSTSSQQQQPPQEQTRTMADADDDNGPFACKWRGCSLFFDDPEDLFSHCTNDHVGRKSAGSLCLKCAWLVPDPGANGLVMECGIEKAKRDHITSHIRVHVPLKPHQCALCNKRFKRPQDLKKHERTHTHGNAAESNSQSGGEVNNNEHVPQFVPPPPVQQALLQQVPAVTVSQPLQQQQQQQYLQASPLAMPAPVPTSAYLAPSSSLSQSPHFLPQQQQQYMQQPAATQHFLHVASPLSPATHGFSPTAPAVNLIPSRSSSQQVPLAGSTPSSSMSMSMSPLAMPYGNMPTPSPLNFNINGIPNGTTSGAALSLGQQQQQQHPYITPNFMPYDNAQTPSPITKAANYSNPMQPGGLAMNMAGRQPSPMPYPLTPDSSSGGVGSSNNNGYMQPKQQFHYSFDTQQPQQQPQQGMYAFGPTAHQLAPMLQPADFPARSLPLKRDAYDDMDELDMFLDNVKRSKIAPSYNDDLAQSLDYLAPGLLSGNLLQTPILATMPAADSTTVLGFLDQLESAVCQQDSDIAAFLDQLDAGVFAADPLLAGGGEMQPIAQQQQPMFTSFAQHTQLPPPAQQQQPMQQQPATRSSSTTSSSSSSYPGHFSATTGASLGAAIGLPAAHVTSPSPSPSPSATPADRAASGKATTGAKKQKDKNALFELRSTSSAEPSTKDLKKKKSKDNVLKAVVDQVAAAAAAAASSPSASSSGSRSGSAPVSKPLGQFMRVAQDLVGGPSSRTAASAARSPTHPPALPPRSPIMPAAATSSSASDIDALAGSMSAMSIHQPAVAPAPRSEVQRAVYHIRAIRALRWHLHDQIAAEKRETEQREAVAAAVSVS